MRQYFKSKNSDRLLLFFAGWACDEYEFEHLETDSDLLIVYDYSDFTLNFDFLKYKEINLIAFSAGVFAASIYDFNFKINTKIAMNGNPFIFDEHFGLSKDIQKLLYNQNEETADEFARNYLLKTDEEYKNFHHSRRTVKSCREEFENLKKLYKENKDKITNIYDYAIVGKDDEIFKAEAQKEFYKDKVRVIDNARHNLFFRIEKYEDIMKFI